MGCHNPTLLCSSSILQRVSLPSNAHVNNVTGDSCLCSTPSLVSMVRLTDIPTLKEKEVCQASSYLSLCDAVQCIHHGHHQPRHFPSRPSVRHCRSSALLTARVPTPTMPRVVAQPGLPLLHIIHLPQQLRLRTPPPPQGTQDQRHRYLRRPPTGLPPGGHRHDVHLLRRP